LHALSPSVWDAAPVSYADLPLDQLRAYRTEAVEPADLDRFWRATLGDARSVGAPVTAERVETGMTVLDTYDVRFPGWGGQRVAGWLHVPTGQTEPLPAVVQYIGYGGGRGLPHENVTWALAGYAHLVMDSRGQASGGSVGVTPDAVGSGPAYPGMMTRGILDPREYYFRRLITDAVRAVDAARSLPQVDETRLAVAGGSQGGGLAIAAAALGEDVRAALVDVPFLCDIARGLWTATTGPYLEVVAYLAAHRDAASTALRTVGYVDGVHLATRATCPAIFSVALMDTTCPPSTGYATYHAWAGEAELREYAYNGHEGGGPQHQRVQLDWLAGQLRAAASASPS
jgi:cephalosporin-C deacetylase